MGNSYHDYKISIFTIISNETNCKIYLFQSDMENMGISFEKS